MPSLASAKGTSWNMSSRAAHVLVRACWVTFLVLVILWCKKPETGSVVPGNGVLYGLSVGKLHGAPRLTLHFVRVSQLFIHRLAQGEPLRLARHLQCAQRHAISIFSTLTHSVAVQVTVAFPVLNAEALLAFAHSDRSAVPSRAAVVLHVFSHVLTLVCVILALVAIVSWKQLNEAHGRGADYVSDTAAVMATDMGFSPRTYSVHAWVGIAALGLWGIQFSGGVAKRFRAMPAHVKRTVRRLHAFAGKSAFVAGVTSCALGLEDMQARAFPFTFPSYFYYTPPPPQISLT